MTPRQHSSLLRKRRLALAFLWFERLWPAVWPALGVVGAYLCLGLLDVPAALPPWPRLLLLSLVVVAAGGLLWRGLRHLARPGPGDADRRLERASALRHRPLATLADTPAAATPEQEALWREHLLRIGRQITGLRIGAPRPGLASRDVWALRGGLLVALVAALGVAGPDAWPRLARAVTVGWPAVPAGPGVVVQAWLTPPAYTGLPPVVLRPDVPAASVPAGSHATVSVTGTRETPELVLGEAGEPQPAQKLDETSWQAEADLPRVGQSSSSNGLARLLVRSRDGALATWALTVIPDQPPTATFAEKPGALVAEGERTLQTRLPWQAADDYGVASVEVSLRLRDRPDAPPLAVRGVVGGNKKAAHGVIVTDLTAHPWAGLAVLARVIAKDAPGQTGASAEAEFTLPERSFNHPVSRALIAVRRQLSLTPEERRPARAVLDGLAEMPDAFANSSGILLNLRAIAALLAHGREPTTVDEAQARMWDLALALEENETERTAHALEQARQALRDTLDPNREQKAEQTEIDRKVQELRDAIQKHLEALAEQAKREGAETPFDPSLPQMDAKTLDRKAEQLQQALKEGRQQDAQRQMAELEKLLDALKNAKPESAEAREQRRAEQRQRGREQMSAVQDMVQREGKLLDRSETRAVSPRPRGPAPSQGSRQEGSRQERAPQPGAPPEGQDRQADAKAQQAMRRALGELMQRYGDLTGEVPAPLGEADQAMRDGAGALAAGRDAEAGDAARRAIAALQRGGEQMGQQMARQFGTGQQQGEGEGEEGQDGQEGEQGGQGGKQAGNRRGLGPGQQPGDRGPSNRRDAQRRDPLGRPLHDGTSGSADAGDVRVPDEMEQARTREIQDELRRRGAERTRPRPELDYIERLLRSF